MATIELAIDLGSSNITIFKRGAGIILKEASVVVLKQHKKKKEVVEFGNSAKRYLLSTINTAQLVYPIREGIIVNVENATLLMREIIKKISPERLIQPHIKAIVLISCGLTVVERREVEEVMLKAGINDVLLVESSLALLAYTNSVGGLFLDIGGGTSEVASVTRGGIATGCSINISGNAFNSKIVDYFVEHYGLKIGEHTAEKLKIDIGSMFDNDLSASEVNGRDVLDSSPRSMEASARDVKKALTNAIDSLIDVVENILNMTPPELAGEILKKGIFISGGSSELPGIVDYISVRIGLPVTQLQDYDNAVSLGGGQLINDYKFLSELLNMKIN